MSAGMCSADAIILNKIGNKFGVVFCMESINVGDYSHTLLISWIVSIKKESLSILPVSISVLIKSYILVRMEL